MDNTNSGNDLNLDPNMMTTQGASPSVSTSSSPSQIIDITPGRPNNSIPETPVTHIDNVESPTSSVVDITPESSAPLQPAPTIDAPVVPAEPAETSPVQSPEIATPVAPVTPEAPTDTGIFKIDTSSPLYEDPDKVSLTK